MQHVDEFIDAGFTYKSEPERYARFVLNYFRMSAILKMDFEPFMREHKLFCNYKGEKYRVTGASRMGDIWLAKDFNRDAGYDLRVDVAECDTWTSE